MKSSGWALEFADDELQNDKEFILSIIYHASALSYWWVSDELRSYLSSEMQEDPDISNALLNGMEMVLANDIKRLFGK